MPQYVLFEVCWNRIFSYNYGFVNTWPQLLDFLAATLATHAVLSSLFITSHHESLLHNDASLSVSEHLVFVL
jgi:hypothetical protein